MRVFTSDSVVHLSCLAFIKQVIPHAVDYIYFAGSGNTADFLTNLLLFVIGASLIACTTTLKILLVRKHQ